MADMDDAWSRLIAAARADAGRRIVSLFSDEPERLSRLGVVAPGLFLDLSKQPWSREGLAAAMELALTAGVERARERLFAGEVVNLSEDRAALHMALRAPEGSQFSAKGVAVSAEVEATRARMQAFARGVRTGAVAGATGKPFKTIIHIGIGGSDLGPRVLWDALKPLDPDIEIRFAANVDGADIAQATAGLDPAETLVIVVSKTFTTLEPLANAEAARDWLRAGVGEGFGAHFAAVSTNLEAVSAFGIAPERVFGFWDWVGGRYSVWSAVSLSCAVALGWETFSAFLAGAAKLDHHFRTAALAENAPVLLALAHVFNRNGLGRPARVVVPYASRLSRLPAYLQQLEMESNGKGVTSEGDPVSQPTASVVFGDAGTNTQHAFFQLLHQGTDIVPADIVAVAASDEGPPGAHAKLLANAIAQAEALMVGDPAAANPQRRFPGDRPSSFILLDRLDPACLGALLALHEHKTFIEGVLWGINSFDQWGVELGKTLAGQVLGELQGGPPVAHDPSTTALIMRLKS